MALLDGKQLRNQSTELGKLSGSGIVSFTAATMSFTSGSVLTTATANIVNPTDVVNKEYVDSVAAGLDPKQSVAYTTTGNIILSGLDAKLNGDWTQELSGGERILVKDQIDKTENGIYVASDTAAWLRAEDHDGTPANEVTLGNFTFVEYGTLAGSGFVLHSTDSTNTPIITPGSDEQEWTLYSQAGAYTAGTGLNLNDGEFEIDVTGVASGSYGSADSTTTFTVNNEGQLTAAADTQISIVASQVTDFDLAAETAIFEDPNFVDGTTIEFDVTAGDSVTAEVSDSSLTSAKLDTGTNGGATAGYVLSVDGTGDFKWILDEGDISSVEAGAGLSGGGTDGDLSLGVNTSNGLSISGDDVVLGGVLSQATTIEGGGQTLDLGLASSQISFLKVNAIQSQESYEAGGSSLVIDKNPGGFTMVGLNGSTENNLDFNGSSAGFSVKDVNTGDISQQYTSPSTAIQSTLDGAGNGSSIVTTSTETYVDSPIINVGHTNTTDIKLNGDFILASASYLILNAGDQNGPSHSTIQLNNDNIGIHATGFTDFTAGVGLNISTEGNANINGNTFSVGATNFDFQGTYFQQSLNDSYTASIGGSYSVEATESITLKTQGDFKLNGDYISASGSAFDVTTDLVSIDSGTGPSQFLSGTDTTISASSSLNLTANDGNISIGDGKGLQYVTDYSSTFVDNSLVTKKYVDSLDAAQITGVEAGNGLIGGGTAGDVTLNLGGTVSENIDFDFGGSASLYLGSQGPNKQMVDFNAQAETIFLYTVDKNFMGTNMSGPPMGALTMAKQDGVHTTTLSNSPVDGKVTIFAYTASLSGQDIDVTAGGPQANLKLSSSNELEIEGSSMSITSEAYTLGQTGASFSYKEDISGRKLGTDFVLGSSSSKLTVSTYDINSLSEVEHGLVIGSTVSSLSFDKTAITLGSVSSFKTDGYVSSATGDININSGLTIGSSGSSLSHFSDDLNGNPSSIVESSLTLGVSGSSFVAGSMSIQSDNFNITGTGASFSFGNGGNNAEFSIGTHSGMNFQLNSGDPTMGSEYRESTLAVGATSISLTTSGYDSINNVSFISGLQVGTVSTLSGGTNSSIVLGGTGASGPISITGLASYTEDYSAQFGTHSLVTKAYVDSLDAAQITGVSAGNGLIGGGTAGDVTLNIGGTVSSDIVLSFTAPPSNDPLNQNGSSFILQNADTFGVFGQDSVANIDVKEINLVGNNQNTMGSINVGSGVYVNSNNLIGLSSGTVSVTTDKFEVDGTQGSNLLGLSSNQFFVTNTQQIDLSSDLGSSFALSNTATIYGQNGVQISSGATTTIGGSLYVSGQTSSFEGGSYLVHGHDGIELKGGSNGENVLSLSSGGATFAGATGIEYAADYSANFTDRSLVDKAYVDAISDTKVSGVTAGAGLSGGGVDGDITLNADLTVDGGLTFSGAGDASTIEVVVDNTTIQVVDGALTVVAGTSQPVYQSETSSVANGDTGIALTSTPNDYSRIEVYVNGQLQNLTENTTGDCYFGAAGTVLSSLTLGDSLHWNSANAGFELSTTDVVKVHYQA